MKKILLAAAFSTLSILSANAVVITQFNFNSSVSDSNTSTGNAGPSTGSGSQSNIGGTTAAFVSGATSSDPAVNTDDSALSLGSYPTQGLNSGTAGLAIVTSTSGFNGISISFDFRASSTASQYYQLQISTTASPAFSNVSGGTGSVGTQGTNNTVSLSNTGLFSFQTTTGTNFATGVTYSFSLGSAVENNPNFAFRLVSVFAPTTSAYAPANSGSTYSAAGNTSFDMVTVNGTAIPEPATYMLMGLGVLICAQQFRRKRS
jgi:hypothetical protein